jgi:hypothetical protein
VQPALAGVVHDSQSADYEHRYGKADQYGGFHYNDVAYSHKADIQLSARNVRFWG